MIPHPPWRPYYDQGLAHLEAGAVDEALQAFDEVYELSGRKIVALRARHEVLARLLAMESGCVGPETAAAFALASDEATTVRLFAFFSALSNPHQNCLLLPGVSLLAAYAGCCALDYAVALLSLALRRRNLIDYLPPEIIAIIGHFVVSDHGSSDAAFTLCAVSRRWRAIFSTDSRLWGTVHLDCLAEPVAIAKLRTHALKGPIHHLVARTAVSEPSEGLLAAMEDASLSVPSLVLDLPTIPISQIWTFIETCPLLRTLVLYTPDEDDKVSSDPPGLIPSLRRLELRRRPTTTTTTTTEDPPGLYFSDSLASFPNLEELLIEHPQHTLYPDPDDDDGPAGAITHPNLRELTLHYGDGDPDPSPGVVFVLPNLQRLDLSGSTKDSYIPYLLPPSSSLSSRHRPNTKHLTHLILRGSTFDWPTLIGHLPDLGALTHLDVRGALSRLSSFELVRALVQPPPDKKGGPTLLPHLQRLDLEGAAAAPDSAISNDGTLTEQSEQACQLVVSRSPAAAELEVVEWSAERVLFCWRHEICWRYVQERKRVIDRSGW